MDLFFPFLKSVYYTVIETHSSYVKRKKIRAKNCIWDLGSGIIVPLPPGPNLSSRLPNAGMECKGFVVAMLCAYLYACVYVYM